MYWNINGYVSRFWLLISFKMKSSADWEASDSFLTYTFFGKISDENVENLHKLKYNYWIQLKILRQKVKLFLLPQSITNLSSSDESACVKVWTLISAEANPICVNRQIGVNLNGEHKWPIFGFNRTCIHCTCY